MSLQVLGSDQILRLNDYTLLGLVESEDWAPNFNATDIFEMGNTDKVDTAMELETSGSINLNSAGNLAGFLARWKVSRTAGTDAFTGWLYNAASSGGKNAYTLVHGDMVEMEADLLIHTRSRQTEFDRTVWLPRIFLTSISGRLDAAGMGTESVQWQGQDAVIFPKPYHDVRTVDAQRVSGSTAQLSDNTVSSATSTLAYVYVNEKRFRNATTSDATKFALNTTGLLTMTTTESRVLVATDVIRALTYKTSGSTTFPSLLSTDRGTSARYIRAHQANIYLAPALTGETPTLTQPDLWLKIQSVDFNIDLRTELLRQIAQNDVGTSVYCRVPTFPLAVSLNVSVYETDLTDWQKMSTKVSTTTVYTDQIDWAPDVLKSSFAVVMQYFTKGGVVVQQINFNDMRIDSAATRNSIGGRSEVTFGLRGTKFSVQGFNV